MSTLRITVIQLSLSPLVFLLCIGLVSCENKIDSPSNLSVREMINSAHSSIAYPDLEYANIHHSEKRGPLHFDHFDNPLFILSRKERLKKYPCSTCHLQHKEAFSKSMNSPHNEIILSHGDESPLDCSHCHNSNNPDLLTTIGGQKIDFDESFLLCGGCHFEQKEDWEGGAHGKRVSNWTGERVIYNCTNCHDPHAPQFGQRWPSTYSPPYDKYDGGTTVVRSNHVTLHQDFTP